MHRRTTEERLVCSLYRCSGKRAASGYIHHIARRFPSYPWQDYRCQAPTLSGFPERLVLRVAFSLPGSDPVAAVMTAAVGESRQG